MAQIDNVRYELLDYQKYRRRLNDLFKNPTLLEMGLTYSSIGKTEFGYNIDCIKVGKGENHLFLVGGTHGSEIISVDFATQLLASLKSIPDFDPNLFSLYVIPLQNPEGFEVTSTTLHSISNKFSEASKEYYLKYRMDNIISSLIRNLNVFINENSNVLPSQFLIALKKFFNTNKVVVSLNDHRSIPEISLLFSAINNIKIDSNYDEIKIELLNICRNLTSYLEKKEVPTHNDYFFMELLSILKEYFSSKDLWENISNNHLKLHQEMFSNVEINLVNKELQDSIITMYQEYNHPLGSQVAFDATGIGINLNANTPYNPGVYEQQNNIKSFLPGARDNIVNHTPGPLGSSTYNANDFNYAKENIALYSLLYKSYIEGHYTATILYHGTGGLIYYLPSEMISKDNYLNYATGNKEIAEIYKDATGYTLMPKSSLIGYGDYIRSTIPNVLMVELSKMGGNPIAPYGDKDNIIRCFNDNLIALNNLFIYFKNKLEIDKGKAK